MVSVVCCCRAHRAPVCDLILSLQILFPVPTDPGAGRVRHRIGRLEGHRKYEIGIELTSGNEISDANGTVCCCPASKDSVTPCLFQASLVSASLSSSTVVDPRSLPVGQLCVVTIVYEGLTWNIQLWRFPCLWPLSMDLSVDSLTADAQQMQHRGFGYTNDGYSHYARTGARLTPSVCLWRWGCFCCLHLGSHCGSSVCARGDAARPGD